MLISLKKNNADLLENMSLQIIQKSEISRFGDRFHFPRVLLFTGIV